MMSRLFNWATAVFNARRSNRRDRLAIGHFHRTVLAFARVEPRIHNRPRLDLGDQRAWEYVTLFYALASSRMLIAEQLCIVVQSHMHSAADQTLLHVRLDLEQLVHQIDALTLAATIELAYANQSSDSCKTTKHLFVLVPAHTLSQRDTELGYMEALFTIAKVILRDLQTQVQMNQAESTDHGMSNATALLSEAQHIIEAVESPVNWSGMFPAAQTPFEIARSRTSEAVLQELLRLIEAAGAELTAPGITQTLLWQEIFDNTRPQAMP